MEFRLIFDTIPEQFDKWRPRYCAEAFEGIIEAAGLGPGKSALEIGPGTGQATEPILRTGCDYCGVELGEHLADFAREKFRGYDNCRIVWDDFVTHDFGGEKFDLVLSAATIQWIPEEQAFPKCFEVLKPGGVLAMMRTRGDYRAANPALYDRIQEQYAKYFRPTQPYTCRMAYQNAVNYGFADFETREYAAVRVYDADGYIELLGTHCDHLSLTESDREAMFAGIHAAIQEAGDRIELRDSIILDLTRKP